MKTFTGRSLLPMVHPKQKNEMQKRPYSEHVDQLREQSRAAQRKAEELQALSDSATAAVSTQRDNYEGISHFLPK